MPTNRTLRKLLPASKGSNIQSPESGSSIKQRCNVSLACTECQKKRAKVRSLITKFGDAANIPNTVLRYNTLRKVHYRRISKAYIAELLSFHAALCRIITTLRSGTSDEISWLIWETQSQETDQEAIRYLTGGYQTNPDL
ncbi:hypothetical protein N7486_004726 [Penicillium sp. IBT 16267x]|nr:hypothetical protein N7486_004726 [Penicillium sp. IBT 16267x]